MLMRRITYTWYLGRLYAYDNDDKSETKFPVAIIELKYGKVNHKPSYYLRVNGKLHSKHSDSRRAKDMIERLFPSDEIAWLKQQK